jgi:hypothetical protein
LVVVVEGFRAYPAFVTETTVNTQPCPEGVLGNALEVGVLYTPRELPLLAVVPDTSYGKFVLPE